MRAVDSPLEQAESVLNRIGVVLPFSVGNWVIDHPMPPTTYKVIAANPAMSKAGTRTYSPSMGG